MDIAFKLMGLCEAVDMRLLPRIISFSIFSYLDLQTFILLFKIKMTRKDKAKIMLSMFFVKLINVMFMPNPYYVPVNIIMGILIFKIITKKNIEKCILGESINAIIIIAGKAIIIKFLTLANTTKDSNAVSYCVFSICMCIWTSILYYIMKRLKVEINLSDDLSKKTKISIMITSIISCAIIHLNVAEMTMFISNFPYPIFLLDIIALMICFYIGISDVIRINELERKNLKIQCLENYNNTLSIMYDSMRVFKHDFSNFVQALDGYAKSEDVEGIKKMTNSVFKDCKSINNMQVLDPAIINNPAIYSIITNKYYLARKENVNMNVEVMLNINEINASTYELCKILGILLDNAIEAAKECDEKIVNIRFVKDSGCNRELIIIENTYSKVDIDIEKIFEKGYSTKTKDNHEHGLGLWTIRKMLQQSDNLNLFTKKGNLFKQQLEIY